MSIELTPEQYDNLHPKTIHTGGCRFTWETGEPVQRYQCTLGHGHIIQHRGPDFYGNIQTFDITSRYRVIHHG